MSIFSNRYLSNKTEEIEAPVFEGYGVEVNGDIAAIIESYDDQLEIVKALHAMDMEELSLRESLNQLEEMGGTEEDAELLYENFMQASKKHAKNAFEKIKQFLLNLFGKIKAFFKSLVGYLDAFFRSSESFAKKYRDDKTLASKDLKGYKVELFDYQNLDNVDEYIQKDEVKILVFAKDIYGEIKSAPEKTETLVKDIKALAEEKESVFNKVRGTLVDKPSVTSKEYPELLYAHFRNAHHKDDKKEKLVTKLDEFFKALENSKPKESFKKAAKYVEDTFKESIKTVEDFAKEFEDVDQKEAFKRELALQVLKNVSSIISGTRDIQMQYLRAWRSALQERDSEYKKVIVGALSYKPKK